MVVDTSAWISYLAGRELPDLEAGLRHGRVLLPPIVAAELMSGRMAAKQRRLLGDLLANLPLCETGLGHWIRVGELRALLARKGLQISTPDAHVAQCCLDVDDSLLTEDRVFRKIAKWVPLRL